MKVLIPKKKIQKRVRELAKQIELDYIDKENLIILIVLKGAFVFAADLIREFKRPVRIEFITAKSYVEEETSGNVQVSFNVPVDIKYYNVLIIEDIVDTGLTLQKLISELSKYNPPSIKVCTLLNKQERRQVDYEPDYSGFKIDNHFVVGYGLDFCEYGRNSSSIKHGKE